jgi:hypothetical protein
MNIPIEKLPTHWTIDAVETSANVCLITAKAIDGRCIETKASETEFDRKISEVVASIHESDSQVAERFVKSR